MELTVFKYIIVAFNIINSAVVDSIIINIINASNIIHITNYSLALNISKLIAKARLSINSEFVNILNKLDMLLYYSIINCKVIT